MRRTLFIGSSILLLSALLILTTVNFAPREKATLEFSTSSHISGKLIFSMPAEIYAGDPGEISVQLDLDDKAPQSAIVELRLDTGFEDVTPAGHLRLGLQQAAATNLKWLFRTYRQAEYPGVFWVWIDAGEGRELVLAKDIKMLSQYYLGGKVIHFRIVYGLVGLLAIVWMIFNGFRVHQEQTAKSEN